MSAVFTDASSNATSTVFTISSNLHTVVAKAGTNGFWEKSRLILEIEDAVSAGTYTLVPDWEMSGPGSKNIVTNGASGLKCRLRLADADKTSQTVNITAEIT